MVNASLRSDLGQQSLRSLARNIENGAVGDDLFQGGCDYLQFGQVVPLCGTFHGFQLLFQTQLVKTVQKYQLAPMFNGIGNA